MKHWQELGNVLERILGLCEAGRSSALAVVTQIRGSGYRRPGAKLLIEPSGDAAGGVSGGCLEEDVRQIGLEVIASGRSRALHYDTREDASKLWGLGLGCDGEVDVAVQRIPAESSALWAEVRRLLQGDAPFALSFALAEGGAGGIAVFDASGDAVASFGDDREAAAGAGEALKHRKSLLAPAAGGQRFIDVLEPPPWVVVCGAGDDAVPLVRFAAGVGFRVVVADHRPAQLDPARFADAHATHLLRPENTEVPLPADARTYVVVKTHSLGKDTEWVRRYLGSAAPYIGVLGPRARIRKILDGLGVAGDARVYGPIGLDLGADGPEQVALSIVAELLAVHSGRAPKHLREREAPLHVP